MPMIPTTSTQDATTEQMRIRYAFWLAVVGLLLAAALVLILLIANPKAVTTSADIVAIVGLFTSVLGTLVGAFFGVQIGSAGRDKEQQNAQAANRLAQRALAALAPTDAAAVFRESATGSGQ